ncbi:MAG: hypothetical protein V4709_06225 [Pseudomonadota bacterium]
MAAAIPIKGFLGSTARRLFEGVLLMAAVCRVHHSVALHGAVSVCMHWLQRASSTGDTQMEKQNMSTKEKIDDTLGSGTSDKVQGQVKSALGTAKATVGKWIRDDEMRANGNREHAEGEVQHTAGEIKSMAAKAANKAEDAADTLRDKAEDVRDKAGVIFDSAKAKAKELADEAKQKLTGASEHVRGASDEAKKRFEEARARNR